MSFSISRRRLLQSATSLLPHPSPFLFLPPSSLQHRTLFNPFKRRKRDILDPADAANKIRKDEAEAQKLPTPGDLAPSSIFEQEDPKPKAASDAASPIKRDPKAMAAALDPIPQARKRWQRKMVIRDIKGRGRLSKTERIARTERSHLSRSPFIKTSVKKLYPLARQIAGKPLADAMVQMRFSRKKAARDVLKHLEFARDEAVVVKGMGLGKVNAVGEDGSASTAAGEPKEEESLVVIDKKGKRRTVTDRSAMYIDEAWVGRGKYEYGVDYRGRGRAYRLYLPYTSISVVLKEEATRIRQAEDREAKRQRKKVWVPLPDRPVTAQRQYPLW